MSIRDIHFLQKAYHNWIRFGNWMGLINTTILLILIYFLVFTPIAFLMRRFKVDLLDQNSDLMGNTYWKSELRHSNSMKRQF